jgi:hypothetical protein
MGQLSILAEMVKKMEGAKNQPAKFGQMGQSPTQPGFARGAMGSMGSKTFQSRNPYAGEQKELEQLQSPIFKEFMKKFVPQTPISQYLGMI